MSVYWPYFLLAACLIVFIGVVILPFRRRAYDNISAGKGTASRISFSRRLKNLHVIIVFLGALILAIGVSGAYFEVKRVRDMHSRELETIAQSVASGSSYDLFARLTFTANDTSNAVYNHISGQLQTLASHYEHIHIYTMVMRDSLIYFGPNSLSDEFSQRILPGEIYEHPPRGVTPLFESGRSLIVDNYRDEYGYFLSAFATVLHPLTFAPVMMVGVDMDAEQLDSKAAKSSLRPLAATVVLLFLLLGGAFYLTQRSVLEFQSYKFWLSPQALFTFLIGLAIGGLIIWLAYTYETRYRQVIFAQSSNFYADKISGYFRTFDANMQTAFRKRHSQNPIDTALFRRRTSSIMDYDFVEACGLALSIDGSDSRCDWKMVHYYDKSSELVTTKDCLERLLSHPNEKIESASKTGLRGLEFSINDRSDIKDALIYQPLSNAGSKTQRLFFSIVSPQALLNEAVASYGEADLFNIKWLEYLNSGTQLEIARYETLYTHDKSFIEMNRQHPLFIFGRVFVLDMQPGSAFIAAHPQRILIFTIPTVVLLLFLTTLIIGVITTERYRLERVVIQRTLELDASENRFSSLFNSALEGIALHRVVRYSNGKITEYVIDDVNPAYCRLVRMSEAEVKGKLSSVIFGIGGSSPFLDTFARVVETGEPAHFNDFFKPLNRHLDVSATLVRADQFATVFKDITETEQAAEALRKSEENYRLLVENQNDLVIKVDLKGQYLYASPSFCKFFGKAESDILGRVFIPQIDESDLMSSIKAMKEVCLPPYRVSFEQKVKSVQGWRWLAWSNSAIFENDKVIGFIGVGREITKRKRSELALKDNQRKLQEQNDEYFALNEEYQALNEELHHTNNELLTAIEKAQESERLKTAFLQNMSHEIRTPLNAVIGFSEMMSLTGFSDEEKEEFSEIVVNNSRQLLSLVDDIMTISTIETQQNKLSESHVHVQSLLTELHVVFASHLKAGVDLEICFPDGDQSGFTIIADEMKLRQIFNNLIGNAIKFTPKGTISYGYDLKKDNTIRFFVQDTGIGILPEVQDKIFERFRQAGESIHRNYGGTGLGLAISKGQVDLMGGRIWVKSEVGQGSVFYFEIPLKQPRT